MGRHLGGRVPWRLISCKKYFLRGCIAVEIKSAAWSFGMAGFAAWGG